MKCILFFVIVVLPILISCGGHDDSKAGHNLEKKSADTVQINPAGTVPDKTEATKEKTVKRSTDVPSNKSHDILINIDKYLVSTPVYSTQASGGITDGKITVRNTLPAITFQKAIVEVSIFLEDGKQYRLDYYILQNIEPGDIKSVPIPATTKGATVSSHIVKIKSDQLTNGETVAVGTRYTPD